MNTPSRVCPHCKRPIPPGRLSCLQCIGGQKTSVSSRNVHLPVDPVQAVVQVLAAASGILLFLWAREQDSTELTRAYLFAAIPGILVLAPSVLGPTLLQGRPDDARLSLVSMTAGLFIGLRSLSILLLNSQLPEEKRLLAGTLLGLTGFIVVANTYPRNMKAQEWMDSGFGKIRILYGLIAAGILADLRLQPFGELMVFTAASVVGGSWTENVLFLVLLALPFVRTPLREPIAATVAAFSIGSWLGNTAISGGLAWRPNPVIAVCCILMATGPTLTSREAVNFK